MNFFWNREKQDPVYESHMSAFYEAVSSFKVEEIETDYDAVAAQELAENLRETNIFLLGEMHGVMENPNIIYTLFKKFGFRILALEWEPEMRKVLEEYVKTGKINFKFFSDSPDGRITAGHFAMIKKLFEEGVLDNVVCFDADCSTDWNKRDLGMSKLILKGMSDDPMLVVAGNYHTRVEGFQMEEESTMNHPMGENIKKSIPNVLSGDIEYLSGNWHNFGVREIKASNKEIPDTASFRKNNNLYNFVLPRASVATVPDPDTRLD